MGDVIGQNFGWGELATENGPREGVRATAQQRVKNNGGGGDGGEISCCCLVGGCAALLRAALLVPSFGGVCVLFVSWLLRTNADGRAQEYIVVIAVTDNRTFIYK